MSNGSPGFEADVREIQRRRRLLLDVELLRVRIRRIEAQVTRPGSPAEPHQSIAILKIDNGTLEDEWSYWEAPPLGTTGWEHMPTERLQAWHDLLAAALRIQQLT